MHVIIYTKLEFLFSQNADIGVLVLLYGGDSIIRVCMNSTLDGLKKSTCDRWKIFSALSVELSYTNEYKCHVIETDSELQSFAAYC